ncbi:thymidylate synthase/dCMP hydroxymethylase domain-containing protein [Ephemerocybe angulata]|uniref:thymidylate synthase n=1 Tax=Ephemerocybe angulata TaxID=980116 RepID=A0A8H6M7M3_9AGAR|nr:thymidylate synthase/dCMP hydroxymethylase domain-containing protein [Tulosesus angulatus]
MTLSLSPSLLHPPSASPWHTTPSPLRGIGGELLFPVRGSTDSKLLSAKGSRSGMGMGVRSWVGASAGGQFGAGGVDQLEECIRKIRENPTDRRIILSAKIYPCQFYVSLPPPGALEGTKPKLSCLMYQRSADLGLGIPFSIASYALLTHMIARVTDTDGHELIIQLGDAHVYKHHVEALEEQLKRAPRPFPNRGGGGMRGRRVLRISSKYADFGVEEYEPHPSIAMKMSV